jgi:hypothetical protein
LVRGYLNFRREATVTDIRNVSTSTHNLANLAEKIAPATNPAAPVLSPPQLKTLQSLATQLRQSPAVEVLQTGTITLFTGPDTSAKTVAAQTLAANLHRDLYRIDLSAIVSKYAADTSNALTQLLHSAATSGAILFFDEADALFGKRTHIKDSHDRYASQSTGDPNDGSSLLQILQQYPGITILAISSMDDWNPAQLAHTHTTLKFPPTP